MSKSQKMRELYDQGMSVSQISKELGCRYQFVYQIISNYTNGDIKNSNDKKDSKSEEFRKLFDEGLSVGEIAKTTNSNYTFVFQVIKKYKNSLTGETE